jgi:hypothetical protein
VNDQQYFYVVVRKDISIADQICQVAHAAAEAGRLFQVPERTFLVLLAAADKAELLAMKERMVKHNIRVVMMDEPDDDLGATALATEAIAGDKRNYLRHYKIWRP